MGLARRAARVAAIQLRGGDMAFQQQEAQRGPGFREIIENIAASKGVKRTDLDVRGVIGETAGEVYKFLEGRGEVPFKDVREGMANKGPLTMMALGWLMREEKLEVKVAQKGILVRLK